VSPSLPATAVTRQFCTARQPGRTAFLPLNLLPFPFAHPQICALCPLLERGAARGRPRPVPGQCKRPSACRLQDKVAVITGADSGIGRAVALAYAREGADVLVAYLSEHEDARETERLVKDAGRRCVLFAGDIADPAVCRQLIDTAAKEFGRIDILVNNAAHQMTFESIEEITDEEWDRTFAVNISAIFRLTRDAVKHMKPGAAIINTASVNADNPSPDLLAYATTKGAIQNFTGGLSQLLAEKGIRVNCVAPGPVWTPLIPASMSMEKVQHFGEQYPMKRPAQPVECAPAYVMLAENAASYVSGATVAITGGKPVI
jgi:NAD(P)-dependent dehydrogenase (short-subunit alcohol dehydrogenase family)